MDNTAGVRHQFHVVQGKASVSINNDLTNDYEVRRNNDVRRPNF